jgi:hypothetical protein
MNDAPVTVWFGQGDCPFVLPLSSSQRLIVELENGITKSEQTYHAFPCLHNGQRVVMYDRREVNNRVAYYAC